MRAKEREEKVEEEEAEGKDEEGRICTCKKTQKFTSNIYKKQLEKIFFHYLKTAYVLYITVGALIMRRSKNNYFCYATQH